jgi:hypothetical protein
VKQAAGVGLDPERGVWSSRDADDARLRDSRQWHRLEADAVESDDSVVRPGHERAIRVERDGVGNGNAGLRAIALIRVRLRVQAGARADTHPDRRDRLAGRHSAHDVLVGTGTRISGVAFGRYASRRRLTTPASYNPATRRLYSASAASSRSCAVVSPGTLCEGWM